MSGSLYCRNRQNSLVLDFPLLRRAIRALLRDQLQVNRFAVGLFFVAQPEMTEINEQWLGHKGSTDVITFDYSEPSCLAGEIFVCADEAVYQAKKYRVTTSAELLRYVIHGLLHLRGHRDDSTAKRRVMKREESRALRWVCSRFEISAFARPRRSS